MKVAVASGKGGTGKTLISTALALSIDYVRFLDLDVEEPNADIFLKPEIRERIPYALPVPNINLNRCTYCGECAKACEFGAIFVGPKSISVFEKLCHGCASCKLACPENAITEKPYEIGEISIGKKGTIEYIQGFLKLTEALATPIIRHMKREYGNVSGNLIIDAPPGTSCPFVQSISDTDFVILVTEPTPFGLSDLKIAVNVARDMKLNFGVIINRSDIGSPKIKKEIKENGIPILMEIPFDRRIAEGYSKGIPLIETLPDYRECMKSLWNEIGGRL
ncbi:MAG TPA: (4Fe-4S)-binding protein [Thermoplasmatales archaeon]|nr:(4Fe-4S)-binding protein [Thermoplasmatales archaeon]